MAFTNKAVRWKHVLVSENKIGQNDYTTQLRNLSNYQIIIYLNYHPPPFILTSLSSNTPSKTPLSSSIPYTSPPRHSHLPCLRQTQKEFQHLPIIRSSQSRSRIPSTHISSSAQSESKCPSPNLKLKERNFPLTLQQHETPLFHTQHSNHW